jgi:O-antigen/teichoic acid export membrane protein
VLVISTIVTAIAVGLNLVQQGLRQAQRDFATPLKAEAGSQTMRVFALVLTKLYGTLAATSLLWIDGAMALAKLAILQVGTKAKVDSFETSAQTPSAAYGEVFSYSASILAISLLDVIMWQRGEMFFLGRYATLAAAGQFALSAQLSQLLALGPSSAVTALLPRLSEKAQGGGSALGQATSKIVTFALIVSVPLFAVGVLGAPVLVKLWKPEFSRVGTILPMLMIGKVALLLSAPVSMALYAAGRQRRVLVVVITCGAIAILSDFLCIRFGGLSGAAWASALNQSLTGYATYVAARQEFRIHLQLQRVTKWVLFGLLGVQVPAAAAGLQFWAALVSLPLWAATLFYEPLVRECLPGAVSWLQTRKLVATNA